MSKYVTFNSTSEGWYKQDHTCDIVDPDGWDRNDQNIVHKWYNEIISKEDYEKRKANSYTVEYNKYKHRSPFVKQDVIIPVKEDPEKTEAIHFALNNGWTISNSNILTPPINHITYNWASRGEPYSFYDNRLKEKRVLFVPDWFWREIAEDSIRLPFRVKISRTKCKAIPGTNIESIGASYSHITEFGNAVGPDTKKIVAYHALITSLKGLEKAEKLEQVFIAFNRVTCLTDVFGINPIGVLDLAGNPIKSLQGCPPCRELIVSATNIENLDGSPDGVEIIRCGHSTFLKSLKGAPKSVKLIEVSFAPNLELNHKDLPIGLEELIM